MGKVKLLVRELLTERETQRDQRIRLADMARETKIEEQTLLSMVNNQATDVSLTAIAALCDYFHVAPGALLRYEADQDDDPAEMDARDIVNRWESEYGQDRHHD